MGFARTILKPLALFAGRHASRQLKQFLAAHGRTRQIQDELLGELIARHAGTGFGRDHGFERIGGYEDFKAAVPVGNYETVRPYMKRVFEGDIHALLPAGERVLMFSQTSGTTGKPKNIPVTRRFLQEMRRGWNTFGVRVLLDHPEGWLRSIIQITSPMAESLSPGGIPCGAISGLLADTQKSIVRRMYVVPPGVSSLADPDARYYTTLRCGVGHDVGIISTANPSSTIKLIETGQKYAERLIRDVADGTLSSPGPRLPTSLSEALRFRPNHSLAMRMERGLQADGQLLPRHFWNVAFLTNWMGGTLKLYLHRLRELFGEEIPIRDIGLLASEGRFSLPVEDGSPAGIAEILGNFLEFMPVDQAEGSDPQTLRAEQVEVGQEYYLIVTNWAGLWRYNMDDRVRVVRRYGQSPVFEFLSRGLHTANITGEKITEHQVVEAMRQAAGVGKSEVMHFVLQGRFASPPYYELRLEAIEGLDISALARNMDDRLCELNIEYHSKRKSDRLGAIRPITLPAGAIGRAEIESIRQRGGRNEQYKHQYLLVDVLTDEQGGQA